jgi:hypothetical protein
LFDWQPTGNFCLYGQHCQQQAAYHPSSADTQAPAHQQQSSDMVCVAVLACSLGEQEKHLLDKDMWDEAW